MTKHSMTSGILSRINTDLITGKALSGLRFWESLFQFTHQKIKMKEGDQMRMH